MDSRLTKVIIPMIRRTFPEFIHNEIIGIESMNKYDRVKLISYDQVQKDNEKLHGGHMDYQFAPWKTIGVEYEKEIITIVKENYKRENCRKMTIKEFKKKYFADAL